MDSKNKSYEYGLIPYEPQNQHKEEPIIDVEYATTKVEKGKKKKKKKKKDEERKEKKNKRTLWICFSNIGVGSNTLDEKIEDEAKNGEFKVKDKILFSNVKTEPSKAISAMENNMRNKSCSLICCSNIQVDKEQELEG